MLLSTILLSALVALPSFAARAPSCVNSRGQHGICIHTGKCSDGGGTSDSGDFCEGGADIQCCTYGECVATSGQPGECAPTDACTKAGGASDPRSDLCPGGTNIQCCTYGRCNGIPGRCQPAASCRNPNPGNYCPGSQNIQCCDGSAPPRPGSGEGCPPAVNQAALDLIKKFEGFEPRPYRDVGGNPTVGYGHLCVTPNCSELNYTFPITKAQGFRILAKDLTVAQYCIRDSVKVPLTDNQYGALVSWAFNIGCGAAGASGSSLVQRLNAGQDPNTVAEQELPKWNKSNGQVVEGLTKRRKAEVVLFKKESCVEAIPC